MTDDPADLRALHDEVEITRRRAIDAARRMVRDGLEYLIEEHGDYAWVESILTVTHERLPKRIT